MTGPCEEGVALCDHPVGRAVQVDYDHGCDRGLCGDESCYWAGGGDALVEEWDAEGESAEWLEDGECGLRLRKLALLCFRTMYSLTFSTFPLTPMRVPRLVYSFCDADNETESMEYGAPITSKRASGTG